ncbi:MAG: hypothetical protein LH679_24650, partial [Cyanobacteria bacterium CAN_BIN43]|nr:hypothetical protein [Cyanobacteria bacterium CAN_BIN43]
LRGAEPTPESGQMVCRYSLSPTTKVGMIYCLEVPKALPPIQIRRNKTLSFLLRILAVSFALLLTTSVLSYLTAPKVPILGFHGIHDRNHPNVGMIQNPIAKRMSYPMQDMEILLDHLLSHNYWFLSAQELYDFFIAENRAIPLEHIGQKPIRLRVRTPVFQAGDETQ